MDLVIAFLFLASVSSLPQLHLLPVRGYAQSAIFAAMAIGLTVLTQHGNDGDGTGNG